MSFNLINANGNICNGRIGFLALHVIYVGLPPEEAKAILALHLALPVGDANLIKIVKFLKIWLCLSHFAPPLDLP